MDISTKVCFTLSKWLMHHPAERTVDYRAYGDWRNNSLSTSWAAFSDSNIIGKDVLDFGCGDGLLTLFIAKEKRPRRIVGVDISNAGIKRAKKAITQTPIADGIDIEFPNGSM